MKTSKVGMFLGVLFAAIDIDAYNAQNNVFHTLGFLREGAVTDLFKYAYFLAFCLIGWASAVSRDRKQPPVGVLLIVAICAAVVVGQAHGVGAHGWLRGPFLSEVRHLSLIALLILACCSDQVYSMYIVPFCIGLWITSGLRAIIALVLFASGVSQFWLFEQRVIALDGSLLAIELTGALISLAVLARGKVVKDRTRVLAWLILALNVVVIVGSFRRLNAVRLILIVALSMTIVLFARRQLIKRFPQLIGFSCVILGIGIATLFLIYGVEASRDRIFSIIQFNTEANRYAGSNAFYIEDWEIGINTLLAHPLVGVGFQADWILPRAIDAFDLGYVGLHMGFWALWVHLGIIGGIVHILVSLWLPIKGVIAARNKPADDNMVFVASSAALLAVYGMFPMGENVYETIKQCVTIGIAAGTVVRFTRTNSPERVFRRVVRGQTSPL